MRQGDGRTDMGAGRRATLWVALVIAAACGQEQPAVQTLVAKVGDVQITAEQLRRFALDVLPGLRPAKQGQAARQDYLQTLIDRQLMLRQARDMELAGAPALRVESQLQRRTFLANLYRKRDLHPRTRVTDADIERFFQKQGLARERRVTAIMVKTEAEAQKIRRQLEAGASFEEMAAQYTLDPRVAERGGKLGFMNRSLAGRTGIPAAIFDRQPTGVVSPPLPIGPKFHLVRFIGDRQVEVASQRDFLFKGLAKAKKREVEQQQVELLAYELDWQLATRGLAWMRAQANAPQSAYRPVADQPLFTYEGGQVSLGEYLEMLKKHRVSSRAARQDSAAIEAFARRAILPELVLADAAEKANYHQEPEVTAWLASAAEELLIKTAYQRHVSEQVAVADADVKSYIVTHPERFMVPESICFDELIAHDRQQAQQLKETLTGAEDWIELAQIRGFELRPRREDGLVCMHSYNSIPYPDLWQALQQAEAGSVEGPVQTREGFALFKVVHKEAARPEPAAQAQRRARAILIQRAEQARVEQWLASLRQKYQDQVEVFGDQLTAALPAALLASLVRETQDD
ncbi:MAG: peptidyl-prolyl cis-trans isomerase [Candidatus Latescibacterota bacterium]|nr:peptidyl-prolyl cis-trans isomerase [Candidatus Latescibacterota bacterium]